jgi:hypothetical protein
LLSVLRAFVNKYHSNLEECIPSAFCAYHNTEHSATAFTPNQLLFGWTPEDLQIPSAAAEVNKTDVPKDAEVCVGIS